MAAFPSRRLSRFAALATIVLTPAIIALSSGYAHAQAAPPPDAEDGSANYSPPTNGPLLIALDALRYDSEQRGPLIVVMPEPQAVALPKGNALSLPGLAEVTHLRLVTAGNLKALVPLTLRTMVVNPGKPDPFAALKPDEAARLLLGTFTAAQWKIFGSPGGIGYGDLSEAQKSFWKALLPAEMYVEKSTPVQTPDGYTEEQEPAGLPVNPHTSRLRINKQVTFQFATRHNGYTSQESFDPQGSEAQRGKITYDTNTPTIDRDSDITSTYNSAYGVRVIPTVTNQLKTGQLDYTASALDGKVSLHFPPKPLKPRKLFGDETLPPDPASALPTVSDLLARLTKVTGFQFLADKRIGNLPYWCGGDSARAGDILMALAWSAGGTFRKLEPAKPGEAVIFLLTEDVEGIGARVQRYSDWAKPADRALSNAIEKAEQQIEKAEPLPLIGFAPGDRLNPGADNSRKIESHMRMETFHEGESFKIADLTPALRETIQKAIADKKAERTNLVFDSDSVQLDEKLTIGLIVPGMPNGEVIAMSQLNRLYDEYFLARLIPKSYGKTSYERYRESLPNQPRPRPMPPGFPSARGGHRILYAQAASPEEAEGLVRSASARGFTDLWLETSLGDLKGSKEILSAAIAAASASKPGAPSIVVGASARMLRDSGIPGTPERNILNETGETFIDRLVHAESPEWSNFRTAAEFHQWLDTNYHGWVFMDDDGAEMIDRTVSLASLPGLGALFVEDLLPPGFTGRYSIDLMSARGYGGDSGYTLAERRACLIETGYDPIDIISTNFNLYINWEIGRFPLELKYDPDAAAQDDFQHSPYWAWWDWRKRANNRMRSNLLRALRHARPRLPVYIEANTHNSPSSYGRFISWDSDSWHPSFVGAIGGFIDEDIMPVKSKETFGGWDRSQYGLENEKLLTPPEFAQSVSEYNRRNGGDSSNGSNAGIIVDLRDFPASDTLKLLTGLPEVKVP